MNTYKINYSINVSSRSGSFKHSDNVISIHTYKNSLSTEEIFNFITRKLSGFKDLEIKEIIKEDFMDKVKDVEHIVNDFFNDLELVQKTLSNNFVDIEEVAIEHYGKLYKIPYNHSYKIELDKVDNDFLINVYYPRFNKEELEDFNYKLEVAKIISFLYLYTDVFVLTENIRNENYLKFGETSRDELREKYEEMKLDEAVIDFALIWLLPRFLINSLLLNIKSDVLEEKSEIIAKKFNIDNSLILRRLYLNETFNYINRKSKNI